MHTPLGVSIKLNQTYLNRIIRLTVTKTENFGKVVTADEYFIFVIHFIEGTMRIGFAKFLTKFLNIVVSRTL